MHQVALYHAAVHRFVARRVRNRADTADIVQETLLTACARFDSFRGENLQGWLIAIARHLIGAHYRHRRAFVELDRAVLEKQPVLVLPSEAVLDVYEKRERLGVYLGCIRRTLSLEEQVAVLLADVHGYRDKESAAVLEMSLPTFKLLLHRARTRLRSIARGSQHSAWERAHASAGRRDRARRLPTEELVVLRDHLLTAVSAE